MKRTDTHVGDYELIVFASPEKRCLRVLESIEQFGRLQRAWILTFGEYDEPQPLDLCGDDSGVIKQYHQNLTTLESHLTTQNSKVFRLPFRLNVLELFDHNFGPPNTFEFPLVVDISCAPRGHLFALLNYLARCQVVSRQIVYIVYSNVRRQAKIEDSYSYGMQDLAVVPGFYGQIRLKQDLLLLVLGFEGNRAFSLYRRLAPNKTMLILGDTRDEDRLFYLENAKLNNHGLLHIQGNEHRIMSSRDPYAFAREFTDFMESEIEPLRGKFNVYFSCLGTKLQTLGAFLALQSYTFIQVVDALPTRRRISSKGGGKMLFFDFGESGLTDTHFLTMNDAVKTRAL